MSKDKQDGFGFLGVPYQRRLIHQLIIDNKFALNILEMIDPNYFTDTYLRIVVSEIKNAFDEDEVVPDFESLEFRLYSRNDNETTKLYLKAQLDEIKDGSLNDSNYVQEMGMKFCKQQELIKAVNEIQKIIEVGDLDSYGECEEKLKKALELGSDKDFGIDVFHNINDVLKDDFRNPVPTGIEGLDDKMNGGLSKGELGVILAPFGVGKTTLITKIANEAFNHGNKVLQIFFEDMPKVIQRKHLSCWTGIPQNDLPLEINREKINETIKKRNDSEGYLELKKFPSSETTIPIIKNYIRKLSASGRKPDVILLDYIDCVASTNRNETGYEGEGTIMRQFETLLAEFDMVGWTAIQGNRSSINAENVDSSMIGGSIKKGQIGHFILSVAKDLDQKENGRANMAILKSRFGVDGIIFPDVEFDNSKIQISIDDNKTMKTSEMDEYKSENLKDKMKNLWDKFDNSKNKLIDSENNENNNN